MTLQTTALVAKAPALPPIRTELAEAKRDLDDSGVAFFANATAPDEIADAGDRLADQAAAEQAFGCAYRETGRLPSAEGANQRVWNLVNKGASFRRLAQNPAALELVKHLLGKEVLLFSLTANIACKGGEPQPLHGDQLFAPVDTPYPLIANCLWMIDEFTPSNGATRVVPGTHRAGRWPEDEADIACADACGPAGTIMVWDGRLWHGAGANHTDTPRQGILAAYCVPFVRQQENATMTTSPDVLAESSDELLTLLGFRNWRGLGMADGSAHASLASRPTAFSGELSLRSSAAPSAAADGLGAR